MHKFLQGATIVFVVLLMSCKKDPNYVYDFSIHVNGNAVLLHQATAYLAADTLNPAHTNFRLTAATIDSSKALTLDIHKNDLNLPTGAYTSPGSGYTVQVNYYENIPAGLKNYSIFNAPGKGTSQYTITITEITSGYIRGNITGNYLTDKWSGNNATVDIPDGSFFALRVY